MHIPGNPGPIAIVEDDPVMGALLVQMLGFRGLPAQLYSGGLALLKSDALPNYQTIVMDLSLPDMDGFELIQKLMDRVPQIGLLIMTGRGNATLESARMVAEGLGGRVVGTLNKPFSHFELCIALKLED
ncbi:MAG: response regulator [Pseudomonadota bacterium]